MKIQILVNKGSYFLSLSFWHLNGVKNPSICIFQMIYSYGSQYGGDCACSFTVSSSKLKNWPSFWDFFLKFIELGCLPWSYCFMHYVYNLGREEFIKVVTGDIKKFVILKKFLTRILLTFSSIITVNMTY